MNLFVASNTNIKLGNNNVAVKMETNYPWDGKVRLNLEPQAASKFKLFLRVPGWCYGKVVPGDLYTSSDNAAVQNLFKPVINGKPVVYKFENGYAVIERSWKKGDVIEFNLIMRSQRKTRGNGRQVAVSAVH